MNISLDDTVRSYMVSQGKNTLHGYVRLMKHLIDFMRDYSQSLEIVNQIVELKLDEKKAVQLPSDFMSASRIAWQSGDRIISFNRDRALSLKHSYSEDVGSATPNQPYNVFQVWPYNGAFTVDDFAIMANGGSPIQRAGLGDNGMGYFRMNYPDREIQFDANLPSPYVIYLEYRSNGFDPKSRSTIPEQAAKAGEDYIHWQEGRRKFGDAAAETQGRKIQFFSSLDLMLANIDPIDYEGLINVRSRTFDVNKIVH